MRSLIVDAIDATVVIPCAKRDATPVLVLPVPISRDAELASRVATRDASEHAAAVVERAADFARPMATSR